MAKGYHVLAGLCRDFGNALRDDADGSQEASKWLDSLDELLELLYDRSDREISLGQEGDEPGSGDDSADEDEPMGDLRREVATVPSVGSGGHRADQHDGRDGRQRSTRARLQQEARPRAGAVVCRIGRGGKR